MNDHQKLKPCPFCGGEAEFERLGTGRCSSIVACTECGGRIEANETQGWNGKAWNHRAALDGSIPFNRKDLETFLMNCLSERGFEETRTLMYDRKAALYELERIFGQEKLKPEAPNRPAQDSAGAEPSIPSPRGSGSI